MEDQPKHNQPVATLQNSQASRLDERGQLIVKKTHGSAQRGLMIKKGLLDLSHLNNPEQKITTVDLNEIIKNVLIDLELVILQKKAVVKLNELPVIQAVPLQINQLFYNLVNNFLNFSRVDTLPELSISSNILSSEEIRQHPSLNTVQTYVELIFADNGIGFDQQYAQKIFAVQRLHNRDSFSGNGIGLALCKKVTENHHGEIFAVAQEEKGVAFHIILPLKQINIRF